MSSLAERFWSKVDLNGPVHPVLGTRCWLWLAYVKPNGYGGFRWKQNGAWTMGYAHRVVFDIVGEPLAKGEQSCHRCDNPCCVNYAEHLFKGSQADNLRDMMAKGRLRRRGLKGELHGGAKLTNKAVAEIRAARGSVKARVLAERYGTTLGYVYNIWERSARKEG